MRVCVELYYDYRKCARARRTLNSATLREKSSVSPSSVSPCLREATTGCSTSAPRSNPRCRAGGCCDGVESRVRTEASSDDAQEMRDQMLMLCGVEPLKRRRLGALGKLGSHGLSRSRPRWSRASGEPCSSLTSVMKMSEPEPDILDGRLTARRSQSRLQELRG